MSSDTTPATGTTRSAARWDPLTFMLGAACVTLAVLVLMLARQNRALKAQLTAGIPDSAGTLAVGDFVAPFDAVAATGETTRIEFGAGANPALLLVFSPDCPACRTNMPAWTRVLAGSVPPAVRILGLQAPVSPSDHPGADVEKLSFPVLVLRAPIDKVPFVPATLLLDGRGKVLQAWFGVLGDAQEAELSAAIRSAASSS